MTQKISAVIITMNEERNIARCLQSLQGVADEIIVLDSFSSDRTEEICKQYEVNFIKHPFEGYIQQKNKANDIATYDLVLSLDADEELSPELQQSVLAIKKAWNADAYRFSRLTNFYGKRWIKHCGCYPDKKLRLWDKRKGRWGGFNPHDMVVMEKGARVKWVKGDILHYTCDSISEHVAKENRYSDIIAKDKYKRGIKVSIMKIIYKTVWRFVYKYFFRLGFLDGFYGFIVCNIFAFGTFLKYAKLRQLYREEKKN